MNGALLAMHAMNAQAATDRPGAPLIIGTGFLALVMTVLLWPVTRHAITIAHEGGHAVTGSASGGAVTSVKLFRDGAGVTHLTGLKGLSDFLTTLNGYLGPSLFGVLGAAMLANGLSVAVLWVTLVFLLLLLFQVNNLFGVFAVLATGTVVGLVIRYTSAGIQTAFAYTWIWFLLMGGFWHVVEFNSRRRAAVAKGRKDNASDAYVLRKLTLLPAGMWIGFWWLATLAALAFGAGVLLGVVG